MLIYIIMINYKTKIIKVGGIKNLCEIKNLC